MTRTEDRDPPGISAMRLKEKRDFPAAAHADVALKVPHDALRLRDPTLEQRDGMRDRPGLDLATADRARVQTGAGDDRLGTGLGRSLASHANQRDHHERLSSGLELGCDLVKILHPRNLA